MDGCDLSGASFPSGNSTRIVKTFVTLYIVFLTGCASMQNALNSSVRDDEVFLPRVGGTPAVVASVSTEELRQLQLVATNLVSALIQIPEMQPVQNTLQVSAPQTAFGNTLMRALEDAGFGLQQVSADQGRNYVTYGKRFSETEAGPVTDYEIEIAHIRVGREFITNERGIFPSSLMSVSGTKDAVNIVLDDNIFQEQGGTGTSFISGVQATDKTDSKPKISEINVNEYDTLPQASRTRQELVLANARRRFFEINSARANLDLTAYERIRRTVLIFDDKKTRVMGRGNKLAIRLLVREYSENDIFVITACTDVDGRNKSAVERGIRVEEEFISHGIDPEAVYLAPCVRASYRHSSDNSPVAVEVIQHRWRNG